MYSIICKMKTNNKKSVILSEVIFITTSVAIIISNFFILHAVASANNTVTGNLATATRLVQESVKEIVNVSEKKTDKLIVINGRFYSWPELFNNELSFPSCGDSLDPKSSCSDFLLLPCSSGIHSDESLCIIRDTHSLNAQTRRITKDTAHFSQKIRIMDAGVQAKKVTVLVWWTDSLGLHKSAITRTLNK